MPNFQVADLISLANVAVALIVGIVTWIISWIVFRGQVQRKELSYYMQMASVIAHDFSGSRGILEIKYNGEQIDTLVLFEVDIKNTGNHPIENAKIKLSNQGGVYLIPGYFEDVPDGYEYLWTIEREDGEDSVLCLEHINPGQTAKARFVMDAMPDYFPSISCPMIGLTLKKARSEDFKRAAFQILEALIR